MLPFMFKLYVCNVLGAVCWISMSMWDIYLLVTDMYFYCLCSMLGNKLNYLNYLKITKWMNATSYTLLAKNMCTKSVSSYKYISSSCSHCQKYQNGFVVLNLIALLYWFYVIHSFLLLSLLSHFTQRNILHACDLHWDIAGALQNLRKTPLDLFPGVDLTLATADTVFDCLCNPWCHPFLIISCPLCLDFNF